MSTVQAARGLPAETEKILQLLPVQTLPIFQSSKSGFRPQRPWILSWDGRKLVGNCCLQRYEGSGKTTASSLEDYSSFSLPTGLCWLHSSGYDPNTQEYCPAYRFNARKGCPGDFFASSEARHHLCTLLRPCESCVSWGGPYGSDPDAEGSRVS